MSAYGPRRDALLMLEQRPGCAVQPWILDGLGRRLQAHDHARRLSEVRSGLLRHEGVRSVAVDTYGEEAERTLGALHDPGYLEVLRAVSSTTPVLMHELTAPGMTADTPVCAEVAAAAFEGARTAIAAARQIVDGARFAYALCRPPGHHAGPGWLGGCCYLNNAAAAAQTLREGGLGPVGILDLDIHYPNGTAAIAAGMPDIRIHSLHSSPVVNAPGGSAHPCSERERLVDFSEPPTEAAYLRVVSDSIGELSESSAALVLSLGYDTVRGDPHGCWGFSPEIFARIGGLLANSRLPVCIVQEGGYALEMLAECSHAFVCGLLDGKAGSSSTTKRARG